MSANQADSYFLLSRLVSYLAFLNKGDYSFQSVYSNENEVYINLSQQELSIFHIQLFFGPFNSVLAFPDEFKPGKNHKPVFKDIWGLKINSVKLNLYDRSFVLNINKSYDLLFKMYGGMGNLLLFKDQFAVQAIRNRFKNDLQRNINEYVGDYDISKKAFEMHFNVQLNDDAEEKRIKKFFPIMSGSIITNLINDGFSKANLEQKWQLFESALNYLQSAEYYVNKNPLADKAGKSYYLDFYPASDKNNIIWKGKDLKTALDRHFRKYISSFYFDSNKLTELSRIKKEILKTEKTLKKSIQGLEKLKNERDLKEIADIIMANIHQINAKDEEVELFDFYNDKPIKIKIDRKTKADEYASNLYRKAKNRIKEVRHLEGLIKNMQLKLDQLQQEQKQLQEVESNKELKQISKELSVEKGSVQAKEKQHIIGTAEIDFKGFRIRYGKNAKANDELTFRHSHKEDVWLHARDKPGSHVVISMQGKKDLPAEVLERAASIAALYSGSKHSSLVPVLYTKLKYVRKFKGAKAGQVKLENFKDILIEPYSGGE